MTDAERIKRLESLAHELYGHMSSYWHRGVHRDSLDERIMYDEAAGKYDAYFREMLHQHLEKHLDEAKNP